jgi:hypothetical protein
MSLILPIVLAISLFFPSKAPQQTAPTPELADKSPLICGVDEQVYASIAESSVKIQPWLLSMQAENSVMEQTWHTFYENLPAGLKSAILPPRLLRISEKDLIKGEAFADRLHASHLSKQLGGSERAIPVVYADFYFGNLLRKESDLYLRQHYRILSAEDSYGLHSSAAEQRFLTWLAYVNI